MSKNAKTPQQKKRYVANVRYDDFFRISLMVGAAECGLDELGIKTEAEQIFTFAGMFLFENFKTEIEDACRVMKHIQVLGCHNNLQPLVEKLKRLKEDAGDE